MSQSQGGGGGEEGRVRVEEQAVSQTVVLW
jgi:hypothetical protein